MNDDPQELSPEEQLQYDLEDYLEEQRMLHNPEFQRMLLKIIDRRPPAVSNWRELFD